MIDFFRDPMSYWANMPEIPESDKEEKEPMPIHLAGCMYVVVGLIFMMIMICLIYICIMVF